SAVHAVDTSRAVPAAVTTRVALRGGGCAGPWLACERARGDDMASTYRLDDQILREQLDEVVAERGRELAALDRAGRRGREQRAGRAAAGAVGIGGGLLLLGSAAVSANRGRPTYFWGIGENDTNGVFTRVLLGAWVATAIAYVLGRLAGD